MKKILVFFTMMITCVCLCSCSFMENIFGGEKNPTQTILPTPTETQEPSTTPSETQEPSTTPSETQEPSLTLKPLKITKLTQYSTDNILNEPKYFMKYSTDGKMHYAFYMGDVENVPVLQTMSAKYDSRFGMHLNYSTMVFTSESVAKTKSETIEYTIKNTSETIVANGVDIGLQVNQEVTIIPEVYKVSVGVSTNYSTSIERRNEVVNTYHNSITNSETFTKYMTEGFQSGSGYDIPAGYTEYDGYYFRQTVYADFSLYAIVTLDIATNGLSITYDNCINPETRSIELEMSTNKTGSFENVLNQTKKEFDISCLKDTDLNIEMAKFVYEDGSEEKPYLINNTEDFNNMFINNSTYNRHFKLTSDITLNSISISLIKERKNRFSGFFDGNNKTITVPSYSFTSKFNTDGDYGLFSTIEKDAELKNLIVKFDIKVLSSKTDVHNRINIGGIVGKNFGTIIGCYASGKIICNGDSSDGGTNGVIVGGICGQNNNLVKQCGSNTNITSMCDAGGIAGRTFGAIDQCYNVGTIGYRYSGYAVRSVGGIVGATYTNPITNCYNAGTIKYIDGVGDQHLTPNLGGIAGYAGNAADGSKYLTYTRTEILYCYNAGTLDYGSLKLLSWTEGALWWQETKTYDQRVFVCHTVGFAAGNIYISYCTYLESIKNGRGNYGYIGSGENIEYIQHTSSVRASISTSDLNIKGTLWQIKSGYSYPQLINNPHKVI